MTNDECTTCGAAYHTGRDSQGNTIKLSRERHLAHVSKRVEQAVKNKKRNADLEAHEKRLGWNWPCGAVRGAL